MSASSSAGVGRKRKRPVEEAASGATPAASASKTPAYHDLSGCTVVSIKLASGSCADVSLKVDSMDARKLLAYSFGRSIASEDFRAAFRKAGAITVLKGEKLAADPATGVALQYAMLQFESAEATLVALDAASAFPVVDGDSNALGLKGMLSALGSHRQDPRELQLAVDTFMVEFERAEEKALEAKAEVAKAMDSDGFVMVKRSAGGAGAGAAGGGAPAFESDNVRRKKKRGGIVVQDFYKFQRQESKLDRIAELRAKFEEDKGRIQRLKDARAFKPY